MEQLYLLFTYKQTDNVIHCPQASLQLLGEGRCSCHYSSKAVLARYESGNSTPPAIPFPWPHDNNTKQNAEINKQELSVSITCGVPYLSKWVGLWAGPAQLFSGACEEGEREGRGEGTDIVYRECTNFSTTKGATVLPTPWGGKDCVAIMEKTCLPC